jgi:hypothetical protein
MDSDVTPVLFAFYCFLNAHVPYQYNVQTKRKNKRSESRRRRRRGGDKVVLPKEGTVNAMM